MGVTVSGKRNSTLETTCTADVKWCMAMEWLVQEALTFPMFFAHQPQLHVVTPFPSPHALYLMVVRFVYCLGHEQWAQLVFFHITCSLGCLIQFCPFPMLNIRFYMKAIKEGQILGSAGAVRPWATYAWALNSYVVILASLESNEIVSCGQVFEV